MTSAEEPPTNLSAGAWEKRASLQLALLPLDEKAMPWSAAFLRRYAKLEPDLADAALVHLAEREGIHTIFTLDHRDFSIYRYGPNRRLKIIPQLAH
jgi:uncharacterized protein